MKKRVLGPCQRTKKAMKHEFNADTSCKGAEGIGNNRTNWYYPNYSSDRPGNWVKSWILEDTCCQSNSSERPSANSAETNLKE